MKTDFEIIWQRIVKFQGESFLKIKGGEFTYTVQGNEIFVSNPSNFALSKENFRNAYSELPVTKPSDFSKSIMGTSYVWGILTDARIVE